MIKSVLVYFCAKFACMCPGSPGHCSLIADKKCSRANFGSRALSCDDNNHAVAHSPDTHEIFIFFVSMLLRTCTDSRFMLTTLRVRRRASGGLATLGV